MPALAKGNWLLVEDNEDDFFLFQRACVRAFDYKLVLRRAQDGFVAKQLLTSRTELPSLIVSDLNMPHVNGLELLGWVRGQPHLASIPFVMLSSSAQAADKEGAIRLGADDYLVKPSRFDELVGLLKTLWGQHLAMLLGHIVEAEKRISKYRALVQELSRRGANAEVPLATLALLEQTLDALKQRRDVLNARHYGKF
jgi:CheY-like chemotaxis protein